MGPKRRRPSQATDDRSETSDTSPNTTPQMKRRKKSVQYDPVGYFCTGQQTYNNIFPVVQQSMPGVNC